MSHWRTTIARVGALLHQLARTGRLLLPGVMWIEARLRASLRRAAALLISALLVLWLLLWRTVRALAARLATSPRTPAWLRQPLVAFQAHDFERDAERLALWWGDWRHEALRAVITPLRRAWLALTSRYGKRQLQRATIVVILLLTVLCGPLSLLSSLGIFPTFGQNSQGTPHHPDPQFGTKSVPPRIKTPAPPPPNTPVPPVQKLTRKLPMPMKPGKLALSPTAPAQFLGSDGLLEVDVPAGAVTAADVAAAGGALSLQISQIAPASGSIAGGSGLITFGMYLVQVVDAHGYLSAHGLRQPATFKLHIAEKSKPHSALDLVHTFVIQNGSLPEGVTGAPAAPAASSASTPSGAAASSGGPSGPRSSALGAPVAGVSAGGAVRLGALRSLSPTVDTTHGILTVPLTLGDPSTSMSWNTHSPVASFGNPDPFNVDLSGGGLTGSYPIELPPAPGGTLPPVQLSYGSAGVNENHGPQASAPWVGEGWNLSLGSVSWSEHNVTANCAPTCGNTWQSSWQISDPYGTGSELIPDDFRMSTYWDDTPYDYCIVSGGVCTYPGWPKTAWRTADGTYTKIVSYVGSYVPATMTPAVPCFRAWLTNGVMEEFGCTQDSVQFYYEPGNGDHITSWLLDLITDPEGNQIHLTYQQDQQVNSGITYPRDLALSTIEYDDPTCRDAQTRCGTWNPLARVVFSATHTVAHPTNTPTGCNTGSNNRCDNPLDLSGSSGLAAPQVESTFVLNDIAVQVRSSSTGSWNTLKDYQLSYEQSGPTTITDPATGKQESTAGRLLLTKLREIGDDSTTALPNRTFGYTSVTQYYTDSAYHPNPTTGNCGPAWNTGNGSGCVLWSQTYGGNSYYLATVDNGMGLHQTFSWANARNNTHGVNGGGANNANPLYCNGLSAAQQATYPCNMVDDQDWSRAILASQDEQHYRAASSGNVLVDSLTSYTYNLTYPLSAQQCPDCVAGFYWGNQNDGDYLDYYNVKYMGFAQGTVYNPDGAKDIHKFIATNGFGVYDTTQVGCFAQYLPCHNSPWWNLANAGHGHETEADLYATDGTTLLHQTLTQYQAVCPPPNVSASPAFPAYPTSPGWGNWNGNRVSGLDHNNPVGVCAVRPTQTDEYPLDGSAQASAPHKTTTYSYESGNYARLTDTTTNSNGGGSALGSPTTLADHTDYIWNDAVSATLSSATGRYLIEFPAYTYSRDSGNTVHYSCSQSSYDGAAYATGQQSTLMLGHVTTGDTYTGCGTSGNGFALSGQLRATSAYDTYGKVIGTKDPDANAGVSGHTGCVVNSTAYTTCDTFDSTYQSLPVASGNALNQTASIGYTSTASGGFGFWQTSATDFNNQASTYAYDALGRMTGTTLPLEGTGLTTTSWSYTTWCADTGAQAPCVEIDEIDRLNSSTTVTKRAFYDGLGRLVETRDPGPGGNDVVAYAFYDNTDNLYFESNSYQVAAYTGGPGSAAFSTPDVNQVGTSKTRDALDRTTSVTDPLSNVAHTYYTALCSPATGDTACYSRVQVVDANDHLRTTLTDVLGRSGYVRALNGTYSGGATIYAVVTYKYDANGNLIQITQPNGTSAATFSFDAAGRKTAQSDPDKGSDTYSVDQNGNLTQTVDARGASGTTYAGYDGLNRLLWRNTTNSPTGARVSYTYDSIAGGNYGAGRLTGETFNGPSGSGLSGSYSYTYDARGRAVSTTTTVNGTSYPISKTYDDAGNTLTQTYPTGEVVNSGFDGHGWLGSVTRTLSGNTTTLASAITYSGSAGAARTITGMQLGNNTYGYSATYDNAQRLSTLTITRVSTGATLYSSAPSWDGDGNVTAVATTLTTGTDNQVFCYDEQNRLIWAGSTGTPSCGSSLTPGSLTSANYTQTFSYDTLGRLTSDPLGSYTYGDAAHLHAATAIGSTWTASYDAGGNMTCRAPTSSTTCAGTPTGQQLGNDNEGWLTTWQNTPSSPTTTVAYLYDGDGTRVAQAVTSSGTTTTTSYIGTIEEVATSGGNTTTTTYYYAGPIRVATGVNGTFSYVADDAISSVSAAFDANGNATASQLYAPYGGSRYSNGTMPGSFGFTGQHSDPNITGLDYYGFRSYDPTAGQFISPDSTLAANGADVWGLSRYAYVEGNPESKTDPDGHCWPICTILAGVVAGAVIGAAVSIGSQAISGSCCDWKQVAVDTAAGAVSGAVTATLGPIGAGVGGAIVTGVVHVGVGAALGAGTQLASNIVEGKPLGDGVLLAAGIGGLAGLATSPGVAKALGRVAGKAGGAIGKFIRGACGESFSSDTPVATPNGGEQAIASLQVGDQVTAYDPSNGKTSTQTVQHIFVNHDTDLLDVTLAPDTAQSHPSADGGGKQHEAEVASHGLRAPPTGTTKADAAQASAELHHETVHTTASHPWLSADHGWITAGQLVVGERVVRADGSTAVVVRLHGVPGAADMYDLTVSSVHTFVVGNGQYVVHNCTGGVPFGFKSFGQFKQFSMAIKGGLAKAGFGDADAAFEGSSVTGRGFRTGRPFGPHSDFDIALVGKGLFNRAKAVGAKLFDPTVTGPLNDDVIGQLGLNRTRSTLSRLAGGRRINFRVYADHGGLQLHSGGKHIHIRAPW